MRQLTNIEHNLLLVVYLIDNPTVPGSVRAPTLTNAFEAVNKMLAKPITLDRATEIMAKLSDDGIIEFIQGPLYLEPVILLSDDCYDYFFQQFG